MIKCLQEQRDSIHCHRYSAVASAELMPPSQPAAPIAEEPDPLITEGIWCLPLDDAALLKKSIDAFECYRPTSAVDLQITSGGNRPMALSHEQAVNLVAMMKRRTDITWHDLYLGVSSQCNAPYQYFLLQIVDLFLEISIEQEKCVTKEVSFQTSHAIFHAIVTGKRLKELHLTGCTFGISSMIRVGDGIRSTLCNLERLVLLRVDLDYANQRDPALYPLSESLSNNTSLKCLEIEKRMTNCADELLLTLNAISRHPTLEILELENVDLTQAVGNQQVVGALARLLTSPQCKLVRLGITSCGLGYRASDYTDDLERLLTALPQKNSLESLDLSFNLLDHTDIISILDCIHDCPNLQDVDLDQFWEAGRLEFGASRLARPHPPTKLRELNLNSYFLEMFGGEEDENSAILQLLQHNPLLGDLGLEFEEYEGKFSSEICHLLDMNRFGRLLMLPDLPAAARIPHSVWPLVLERSNRMFAKDSRRGANVIFHFLSEGILFFGR